MKILLATDLYTPAVNGVVTSTVSLKGSLENLGHEVRVLTLSEFDYIDRNEDIYAVSSMNVNKIYPGARVRFFRDRSVLRQIINWKPDIIHTQSEFSTFRMAKYITQFLPIPIVHTYHTVYEDYTHYFSPSKKTGRKVVSLLTKKRLSDAEAVIVPTNKVARLLKGYEVEQPISVIPTGIELGKFRQKANPKDLMELRKQYGIPEDTFLFVSLGRLGKEKNIEELLYFLSMIKLKPYLLIVGDGPDKYNLQEYAKELGLNDQVIFTGMINPKEVPLYYQVADLFVSASTSETQGLTYIEALASGLPALCREDESIENVIMDGLNGYQYRSFKEFESCLYKLIKDKEAYANMASFAKEFALSHYSSTSFGEQVYEIYEQALESYQVRPMMQMHP